MLPEHKVERVLLAGIDIDALAHSIEQFCTGKVDEHHAEFVPSTAVLVRNAAKWQAALHPPAPTKKLVAPEEYVDPAMRKRVSAMLMELADKMAADEETRMRTEKRRVYMGTSADELDHRPLNERLRIDG